LSHSDPAVGSSSSSAPDLARAAWAAGFAAVALDNVTREYPYAAHMMTVKSAMPRQ
jgi:hypothetical protein